MSSMDWWGLGGVESLIGWRVLVGWGAGGGGLVADSSHTGLERVVFELRSKLIAARFQGDLVVAVGVDAPDGRRDRIPHKAAVSALQEVDSGGGVDDVVVAGRFRVSQFQV